MAATGWGGGGKRRGWEGCGMDGGLEGDRLCPAKMPVRPTMVIELKTAARRRCRRRRRLTRSRAGRITVKNAAADDPTAMKGAPAMSTLGRPRDSCEAVVRAPPGKWAVFAFLCGDGLEGWRHLDGDEERGAPQTRHLIGRTVCPMSGEIEDAAAAAWAIPARSGRGAAGRGAGAVARNHAGRGSRRDRVQGEGGGAARAVARAPARVARAGREREGREREWRGAGSAARGPGPRVGRRARQGVARIYRGSHSIGGGRFCVLREICREETLFTALFFRRKYALCVGL